MYEFLVLLISVINPAYLILFNLITAIQIGEFLIMTFLPSSSYLISFKCMLSP
jgi:hypothetical protein